MVNFKGFTLVELMIVVAIIGILAAIAYPSYIQYLIKANRVDAQAEMTRIASLMQRYKLVNSTYLKGGAELTLSDLSVSQDYPSTTKNYEFELSNVTADTWTLTAKPYGMQLEMAILFLIMMVINVGAKAQIAHLQQPQIGTKLNTICKTVAKHVLIFHSGQTSRKILPSMKGFEVFVVGT